MSETFKTQRAQGETMRRMTVDLTSASDFMAAHARLLDRRRFDLLFAGASAEGALAALEGYRNPDGGYGWGLEPDLRARESQPGGALHALEVFDEAGPVTTPRAAELCDWLASASLPDGGLPFAFPVASAAATAPFWANADASQSSLHITSAVAAAAHRVARHDPAVADHEWLAQATHFCFDAIDSAELPMHTLQLRYALALLDETAADEPAAPPLLERLAAQLPASGSLHVQGGAEDEKLRPLDFSPYPDRPLRRHLADDVIAADLDRLADEQLDDGGWNVDFRPYSPAAALEWRGYTTVHALTILRANGRVDHAQTVHAPAPRGRAR